MTKINTVSGKQVDIEDPRPETIDIEDIAHALSFICRGCGNTRIFFPVARHCVWCAREAKARGLSSTVILACLLHDASEAYMMDLPKPIKDNLLPQYRSYENNLLDRIYQKFIGRSLTAEEEAQVAAIDRDLLMYDLKFLLNVDNPLPELHIETDYEFEPFEDSRNAYLFAFREYSAKI